MTEFNAKYDKVPPCAQEGALHNYQKAGEFTYTTGKRYVMICCHCLDAKLVKEP